MRDKFFGLLIIVLSLIGLVSSSDNIGVMMIFILIIVLNNFLFSWDEE